MKTKKEAGLIEAGTPASHIGVLYEAVRHDLELVLEKLDAVEERIEVFSGRVQKLEDLVAEGNFLVRTTLKTHRRLRAALEADVAALGKKAG